MKKVTLFLTALVAVIAFGLYSCGGSGGGNTPSNVVVKGMKLMTSGNYDDAVKLYAKKDGTLLTEEEAAKVKGMMPMAVQEMNKKAEFKDVEAIQEDISEDGNTAKVKYKIFYKDGSEKVDDIKLIKIDGNWYMLVVS